MGNLDFLFHLGARKYFKSYSSKKRARKRGTALQRTRNKWPNRAQ